MTREELKEERRIKRKLREEKEAQKPTWRVLLEYVIIAAIGVLVAFLLCKFVIINAIVPSSSMYPTIKEGDKMIGYRLAYVNKEPKRGDIVIFKCPEVGSDYDKPFVKRLIGLPGETVSLRNGEVWIIPASGAENAFKLSEDYLLEPMIESASINNKDYGPLKENEYFFMGDNRNGSHDCRYFGAVTRDRILAKVVLKYYPGFKAIKSHEYNEPIQ